MGRKARRLILALISAGGALVAAGFVNKLTGWMLEVFEPWVDRLIRWGI
jgi:hypothetical protein